MQTDSVADIKNVHSFLFRCRLQGSRNRNLCSKYLNQQLHCITHMKTEMTFMVAMVMMQTRVMLLVILTLDTTLAVVVVMVSVMAVMITKVVMHMVVESDQCSID
ncbi:hypothetical protein AK812_SmicGene23514 [Symbiodinium microadriaticum]|uniref:Uncharacterized protein n=1 Tax=Symbiodinium microadriaticum TaxID=2951 RepID=A0A1Q9DH27_SYMMI|nr:hypothetical protein AK812_SmicGene23514 [Symbiodinium microadriaticum]